MPDIRSFVQHEVTTKRGDSEDVGTIETSDAPVENIPLPVTPIETPAPEVPPTVDAAVTEHVTTTEHVSVETPQGEVVESEVNIITSTSAGNDCSVLNSANIFYIHC